MLLTNVSTSNSFQAAADSEHTAFILLHHRGDQSSSPQPRWFLSKPSVGLFIPTTAKTAQNSSGLKSLLHGLAESKHGRPTSSVAAAMAVASGSAYLLITLLVARYSDGSPAQVRQ